MPRTRVFDEGKVLEATMLTFWKNGYEATSIQMLEQETGLKRTSLYNAYGNKRDLFTRSLMLYLDEFLTSFLTAIEEAPTAKQAVEAVLNETIKLHFKPSHPGGCMIVLSLLESHQHDTDTRLLVEQALEQLRDGLCKRFIEAVKVADLPPDTNCEIVADEVIALITGTIVMAKANISKDRLEAMIALTSSTILPAGTMQDAMTSGSSAGSL